MNILVVCRLILHGRADPTHLCTLHIVKLCKMFQRHVLFRTLGFISEMEFLERRMSPFLDSRL